MSDSCYGENMCNVFNYDTFGGQIKVIKSIFGLNHRMFFFGKGLIWNNLIYANKYTSKLCACKVCRGVF